MSNAEAAEDSGDSEEVDKGLAAIGAVIVVALVATIYVFFAGGGPIASGIVMLSAVALGSFQAYRNREAVSLISAVLLVMGGGYGFALAITGSDPFAIPLVVGMLALGLFAGLFAPEPEEE